jgi:hypothetical protein
MSARIMSNKQIRDIQRAVHLLTALSVVLYIYLPVGSVPLLATLEKLAVLPLLALTGLLMWQWTRLRRWLTSFGGESRPQPRSAA